VLTDMNGGDPGRHGRNSRGHVHGQLHAACKHGARVINQMSSGLPMRSLYHAICKVRCEGQKHLDEGNAFSTRAGARCCWQSAQHSPGTISVLQPSSRGHNVLRTAGSAKSSSSISSQ
jgi:hypothetical protein